MGVFKDLTGEKIGKVTVLKRIPAPDHVKKKAQAYWDCLCECGNHTTKTTDALRHAKTPMCWDCSHIVTGSYHKKDRTGEKFGKLTVKEMIYEEREETKVLCVCDCGKEVVKRLASLVNDKKLGYNPSCGCDRHEKVIATFGRQIDGQRFGSLVVLETIWEHPDYDKPMVKCQCDCGNIYIGLKNYVQSGHTKSCGCSKSQIFSRMQKEKAQWAWSYVTDLGTKILYPTTLNEKNQQLWMCECFCGNRFEQLPAKVKAGRIQSCGCLRTSGREIIIEKFLKKQNIKYQSQYSFDDLWDKGKLRFDFAILDENNKPKVLIEYDGQQHFIPVKLFGGEENLERSQYRDNLKNEYCKLNNLKLLRLKYDLSDEEIKSQILNAL